MGAVSAIPIQPPELSYLLCSRVFHVRSAISTSIRWVGVHRRCLSRKGPLPLGICCLPCPLSMVSSPLQLQYRRAVTPSIKLLKAVFLVSPKIARMVGFCFLRRLWSEATVSVYPSTIILYKYQKPKNDPSSMTVPGCWRAVGFALDRTLSTEIVLRKIISPSTSQIQRRNHIFLLLRIFLLAERLTR